jgi:1-phosphatidylinositol phosphodiesterase
MMKNGVLGKAMGMLLGGLPLAAGAAGNNWMSTLDGTLPLSQFSIPGTHDSGATVEPISGTAKAQNLSIGDQLNAGIRFLDVRCRHINNAFAIHHGQVYQNLNFDDVLNATFGFLNSNPNETVIMSVKQEYTDSGDTRSFEDTFDAYVAQNPTKWLLTSSIPTLSAARGKIVLFRRFGASRTPKGIDASNWPDDTSFSTDSTLRVQDHYNVSNNDTKWGYIQAVLNEAYYGGPNTLYVNFSSGVQSIIGIPNITGVSNNINPRVATYFSTHTSGRFGALLMDFADATKASAIYATNAPASGLVSRPAYFMIVNKNSGKCLDLIGGNSSNGAAINQWTFDANGPNQRWSLEPTENSDHFHLSSWVSGKCACIDMDSTAPGAVLHAFDYTGNNPGQQFDLVDAGNGYYKIRNTKSGLILEVAGSSTADNATVQQNTDSSAANQLWRLQPWGDYFAKASTGKYVCVANSGSSNGNLVVQYTWENNPWFKWRFENVTDAHYKLSSLNALGRVLCVVGGSTANAANTQIYDYNVANAGDQKLRIFPKTNGKFKFYFVHDGMTWDIPGGNTGNLVNLQQYPDNGNAWQEFLLERVSP